MGTLGTDFRFVCITFSFTDNICGCIGNGSRTWSDGSIETGFFSGSKIHGKGKTVNSDGDVFEGSFHGGVPSGQGTRNKTNVHCMPPKAYDRSAGEMKFANGDWFKGTFEKGLPVNGESRQTAETDGQFGDAFFLYEGHVQNGMWHGKGKLVLYEKRSASKTMLDQYVLYTYDGEFANGKFNGIGKKIQCRDNDGGEGHKQGGWTYEGEWKEDEMSGQGKITYSHSGSTLEGTFKHGHPHGVCSFKAVDGQYKQGKWVHGHFKEGLVRMLWEDGRSYEGRFVPNGPSACMF